MLRALLRARVLAISNSFFSFVYTRSACRIGINIDISGIVLNPVATVTITNTEPNPKYTQR